MLERLGATQIVRDDGHSGYYDQVYEEFPLVDRLVLESIGRSSNFSKEWACVELPVRA